MLKNSVEIRQKFKHGKLSEIMELNEVNTKELVEALHEDEKEGMEENKRKIEEETQED